VTGPDALRRAFDNLVANWPLILIRVAETAVVIGCMIAALLITVLPILVAIGIDGFDDFRDAESITAFFEGLMSRWALLGVAFVVLLVVAFLMFLLHAFVEAGVVRVYVDAERAAGPAPAPRERFAVFSGDRWLEGATSGWKRVFWIYNIIWGIWGLIVAVPVLFGGSLLLYFASVENLPLALTTGCATLALFALIAIPTAIVANAWTQKAVVIGLDRGTAARESTRLASAEIRADLGAHAIVVVAVLIVSFVLSGAFNGMSAMVRVDHSWMGFGFAPMQAVITILNACVSAATAGWMAAAFAAIHPKGK
jgi:hypothetical protein